MSFRFKRWGSRWGLGAGRWAVLIVMMAGFTSSAHRPSPTAQREALRVCSDPNNLPFSDSLQHGFENRIASMLASDMHARLEYTWWPQRRGFVRNTLKAGDCDVVIGVPSGYDMVAATAPYYQSTYVFVTRADAGLSPKSFDDRSLRHARIGIHMMGDDYANSPAAVALMHRGLGANIHGYMIYGNYNEPSPPSRLLDAVVRKDVDVAIAWGPLAGYYARHSAVPLVVTPVSPRIDTPFLPFVYSISMGVRRGDTTRKAFLDSEIVRRHDDIRRVLGEYGVPLVGGS
ncbi:MAG TPA: substrate-binding domain-containing protein [Gemmatimonadaceae bacterium]|nr:substrate-binding domain-containing protein [Gemmatimonadaceae bacterium]